MRKSASKSACVCVSGRVRSKVLTEDIVDFNGYADDVAELFAEDPSTPTDSKREDEEAEEEEEEEGGGEREEDNEEEVTGAFASKYTPRDASNCTQSEVMSSRLFRGGGGGGGSRERGPSDAPFPRSLSPTLSSLSLSPSSLPPLLPPSPPPISFSFSSPALSLMTLLTSTDLSLWKEIGEDEEVFAAA